MWLRLASNPLAALLAAQPAFCFRDSSPLLDRLSGCGFLGRDCTALALLRRFCSRRQDAQLCCTFGLITCEFIWPLTARIDKAVLTFSPCRLAHVDELDTAVRRCPNLLLDVVGCPLAGGLAKVYLSSARAEDRRFASKPDEAQMPHRETGVEMSR